MKATTTNSRSAWRLPHKERATSEQAGKLPSPKLVGTGAQFPLHPAQGWDPYEVWCTRIRTTQLGPRILVPRSTDVAGSAQRQPQRGTRTHCRTRRSYPRTVLIWVSVVLAVSLGVTGALVGLWGVDIVALVFGVMTPAARAVYALLGIAAVYCAIKVVVRQPTRRAGRH